MASCHDVASALPLLSHRSRVPWPDVAHRTALSIVALAVVGILVIPTHWPGRIVTDSASNVGFILPSQVPVGHTTRQTWVAHQEGPAVVEALPQVAPQERSPEPWCPLQSLLAPILLALLVAASTINPSIAHARNGAIAPPTCVSIVNAATNCPPRPQKGSVKNAEVQVAAAREALKAAEAEAGKILGPGESKNGEPELYEFWKAEQQRLLMNKEYIQQVVQQLTRGGSAETAQPGSITTAKAPARFVSRLSVSVPDVEQEVKFWCEAVGMQRYADLPGGGAVVAFGPPQLDGESDEGAFFGIEFLPAATSSSSSVAAAPSDTSARLSFVQVATPSLIRISKVVGNGGELVDGYGYYGIRSPSGIDVRAYVDDRRDPVEFVALAANEGAGTQALDRKLRDLGLEPRGAYQLVSPVTQAYMPTLPDGNCLYAGSVAGDAKQKVQVLVLPIAKPVEKNFFDKLKDSLPKRMALVQDEEERYSLGFVEAEKPEVTFSSVQKASLAVVGPSGTQAGGGSQAVGTATASGAFTFELRSAVARG